MKDVALRRQLAAAVGFTGLLAALLAASNNFLMTVLMLVFLNAVVGIAWNLMMGYAGQLSVGHALHLGIGAYIVAVFSQRYGVSPWVAMVPAFVAPALIGVAIGALGFRFSVRGVYFALLTIAFAELARIVFEHWGIVGRTGGFFLKALPPDKSASEPARQCHLFLLCSAHHDGCRLDRIDAPGAEPIGLFLARRAR